MPSTALKLVPPAELPDEPALPDQRSDARPLGQILKNQVSLSGDDIARALDQQSLEDVKIGKILLAHGMISESDLLEALSTQYAAPIADLDVHPVDMRLIRKLSPEICLRYGFLPWVRKKGKIWIVSSNPAEFDRVRAQLPADFGPVELALVSTPTLERHIARVWSSQLSGKADQKCPPKFSCRSWARPLGRPLILGAVLVLVTFCVLFPALTIAVLYVWVMINLISMSILRLTALGQQMKNWLGPRSATAEPAPEIPSIARLPKVSVLVPLYKEHEILPRLITRLARTDYPKELLDICLVLEESDRQTQMAVQKTTLPPWMRVVQVPSSRLKTKPRAMNYALDFCQGDIVGIYDAEDAPEADQIMRIVRHFRRVGPEVACIQAYLDYYNPRQNWLARCFSIEYAIWFRLVLQGVERMRLPVPLGGTSVFFAARPWKG